MTLVSAEIGGALLTPESIASPTAEKKTVGSLFVCEAENLEAVKEMIETDVYYRNNVVSSLNNSVDNVTIGTSVLQWDKEKLVILPFLQAAH